MDIKRHGCDEETMMMMMMMRSQTKQNSPVVLEACMSISAPDPAG